MAKRLKASDIYGVANYTRNQFRGLLDELGSQFEGLEQAQPRVARTYTPQDFLVILVACELDSKYCLRRTAIASLLPQIVRELSGPRPVAIQPKLILNVNPPSVRYVDTEINISEGLVLPLTDIFMRVDGHLLQAGGELPTQQNELNFGPMLIQGNTHSAINEAVSERSQRIKR